MNAKVSSPISNISQYLARWNRWGDRALLLLRAAALLGGAWSGWHAFRIFYDNRFALDDTLPWYGLAFALILAGALRRSTFDDLITGRARAVRYVRAHPVEMAVLAAIFGMGVFIRVWNYGTLPPDGFLCCEEGINAGVVGDIRDGTRPLNYALVRYSTAAGLWLFGDNTDGLRLPFVAFGIAAMLPFYLLMRELTRIPAALFATGLFASLHVLGDTSIHFQPGLFASMLFAFTLVRGLKTGNALWWMATGFLAAVLSYEYEVFKVTPIIAAAFVLAALFWTLFWPLTPKLRVYGERAGALTKRAWFPALLFALTVGIAITPMVARQHHGVDIYVGSLDRQQAQEGRAASGLERLFSPNWQDQVRWVTQIYTPFVVGDYVRGTSVDARGVVDRTTRVLLWVGVLAGVAAFWRSWRLLFLLWFVGGSAAFGLLVQNFAPWKLVGFIPAGLVLVGLFADDLWGIVRQRHRSLSGGLLAGMVVAVGFVFTGNTLILRANATDVIVLHHYEIAGSEIFATCTQLQARPDGNYTYLAEWSLGGWGFAQPRGDKESERFAWRTEYIVCNGLQGMAVPSGEELWPQSRAGDGTVTLAMSGEPANVTRWQRALERAMPDLGEPVFALSGPTNFFQIVGYEFGEGELASWQGLWAVDAGDVVDPMGVALGGTGDATQLWALVQVPSAAEAGWALTVEGADGEVRIDGTSTFSSTDGDEMVTALSLAEGWHVVEATLRTRSPGEEVRFLWRLDDGQTVPAFTSEFVPLPDYNGWLHTRVIRYQGGPDKTLSRFDYDPHVGRRELTHPALSRVPATETWAFADDIWRATWEVPADGTYSFGVISPGSEVELLIDDVAAAGEVTQTPDGVNFVSNYELPLIAGEHRLELRFHLIRGDFVGGQLKVTDEAGTEVELNVRPY